MSYVVIVAGLGGLILYNLSRPTMDWIDTKHNKQERLYGMKHGNINMANLMSKWQTLYNPKYFLGSDYENRKMMARIKSFSPDPTIRKEGTAQVIKYDYRRSGAIGPAPPFVAKPNV